MRRGRAGSARAIRWMAVGAIFAAALGCSREPGPGVLLISIDTLRADHVGAYGQPRPTTPSLDRLAAEGVVFERAFAPSPWTLPSHGTLLTGRAPQRHGLLDADRVLAPELPTLAEQLAAAGVRTAAFVNVGFLSQQHGLHRGFGHFAYLPESGPRPSARRAIGALLEWLGGVGGAPFFVFFHTFDVHSDYVPGPEQRALFTGPYAGPIDGTTASLRRIRTGAYAPTPADVAHARDLYAGGVRRLDDALGELFAALERSGLAARTHVIVTSDHGEEFFEHGNVLHGRTLYEEMVHVPLIARGPGIARGVRVAAPVELADLAPTIRTLLGASPAESDGVDLAPWLRGAAPPAPERVLFAETAPQRLLRRELPNLFSVRTERIKLIRDLDAGAVELFDLDADPREQSNLADAQPETVDALRAPLDAYAGGAEAAAGTTALTPEQIERLRALGYAE